MSDYGDWGASRSEVYAALDSERDYQDSVWPENKASLGLKPRLGVGSYLTMLQEYVRRAQEAWANNANIGVTLDIVRKIGGIVVTCGENHGLPLRDMTDTPTRKT